MPLTTYDRMSSYEACYRALALHSDTNSYRRVTIHPQKQLSCFTLQVASHQPHFVLYLEQSTHPPSRVIDSNAEVEKVICITPSAPSQFAVMLSTREPPFSISLNVMDINIADTGPNRDLVRIGAMTIRFHNPKDMLLSGQRLSLHSYS